jgi:hypothetical protein
MYLSCWIGVSIAVELEYSLWDGFFTITFFLF